MIWKPRSSGRNVLKPAWLRLKRYAKWQQACFSTSSDHRGSPCRARGSITAPCLLRRLTDKVQQLAANGREWVSAIVERLGIKQGDPLVPRDLSRRSLSEIAAVHAVASAIRQLSEREAAFAKTDIYKAALDFGLPTAMPQIEQRVGQLLRQGQLLKGKGADRHLVTTADALAAEQRILASVDQGRGAAPAVVSTEVAGERLQALSQLQYGITLNPGQEGAGRLILGSHNRIIAVQGIAGAGKSTLLKPVADILREEGREVLGLAVQNTLVQIPGVGPVTSLIYSSAVDDPGRFKRSRNVAAYFGLTSRRWQSGTSIDVKGRISKVGDPDVRRALYEAASAMLTRFKGRDTIKTWGLKLAKTKCHAKARVAVARKLAIVMHAMWRDGTFYVGDPDASMRDADANHAAKLQRLSFANS